MSLQSKVYLAVSGTGTGNQWTAGGANVGVDQSGTGGTASTAGTYNKILSVFFQTETNPVILRSKIVSVILTVNLKKGGSGGNWVSFKLNGEKSVESMSLTTSYTDYTKTYSSGWTWSLFNTTYAGCVTITDPVPNTVSADKTYLTVNYLPYVSNLFFFKH